VVTVHPDELAILWGSGNRRYLLAEIEEGWLEDAGYCVTVVLRMHSGDLVSIGVGTAEEGAALLRAARVAAHQQIWTTRLASNASLVTGGGCLSAVATVALAVLLVVAPMLIAGAVGAALRGSGRWADLCEPVCLLAADLMGFFLLLRAVVAPVLVIGGDGISIRRFGRRRRFVPYADVARVRRKPRSVVLMLSSGEVVPLPTGEPDGPLSRAVHDRIVEAMGNRREPGSLGGADLLDRAGRSPSAWREHLLRLGQDPEGYRTRRLPPERLASVLEDVASPPERRVAAALALARVEDPTLRLRVHHAVASCADESLRAALEAAAADEIAEEELLAVAQKRI
jgi:hypothetical protein